MAQVFAGAVLLGWTQQQSQRSSGGYPPFDLERIPAAPGQVEILRITFAVAGFAADDLGLAVEDDRLIFTGRRIGDETERTFLHRGIAMRGFQRSFPLTAGVEVLGAHLRDGLLTIELARPEHTQHAKKVEIAVRV